MAMERAMVLLGRGVLAPEAAVEAQQALVVSKIQDAVPVLRYAPVLAACIVHLFGIIYNGRYANGVLSISWNADGI